MKTDTKLVCQTPETATSNITSTFAIDTLGFGRAVIDYWHGAAVTTNPPAVLKVGEGTSTSSYTDISAFTAGIGFTAAAQTTATTTTNAYRIDIDLRGRERYLQLTATPSTGQGATALTQSFSCNLFRAATDASDATGQNVNQLVQG
jgi:hypothetical protein